MHSLATAALNCFCCLPSPPSPPPPQRICEDVRAYTSVSVALSVSLTRKLFNAVGFGGVFVCAQSGWVEWGRKLCRVGHPPTHHPDRSPIPLPAPPRPAPLLPAPPRPASPSALLWSLAPSLAVFLLFYAVAGTWVTAAGFGRRLMSLTYAALQREADLRFALVRRDRGGVGGGGWELE